MFNSADNGAQNTGTYMYSYFSGVDPVAEREMRGIKKYGILAGAALLAVGVMQLLVAELFSAAGLINLYRTDSVYQGALTAVFQLLYLFLPFFAVYLLYSREDKNSVDVFTLPKSGRTFVLLVFAGLAVCFIGETLTDLSLSLFSVAGVNFVSGAEDLTVPDSGDAAGLFLSAAGYAVMPALVEEFAFRGVILQPLRKYGDTFAVVASSAVFALVHGNMVQIPFAFVAGLALGYVCVATGSIWTGSAIHFINNLFSVIFSVWVKTSPETSGFGYIVISAAIVLIGSVACFFYLKDDHYKPVKENAALGRGERAAVYFCAPTMVLALANAAYSSYAMQNTTSFFGFGLLAAIAVLFAVKVSKSTNNIRRSTRYNPGKGYGFSKAAAIVSAVALILLAAVKALGTAGGNNGG